MSRQDRSSQPTIRTARPGDVEGLASLWNACCRGPGAPLYQQLSESRFSGLFLHSGEDFESVSLVAEEGGSPFGFANGTVRPGAEQAYITTLLVAVNARRRGVGTRLLTALEETLLHRPAAASVNRFEIVFFNPITITWIIPGSDGHDHPNTPGVDVATGGYLFFKNRGYRDFAYQNSYYLPLSAYQRPANIEEILSRLGEAGMRVCRYEADRHTGLDELFDDLGSEDWQSIVTANFAPGGAQEPVLIVEDGNRVCGFAGPLHVQDSGRGYFAGIGVHSAYRGRGAAKALFSGLCSELKEMGAEFMSLFTGETNPARNIYEAAGFKIVRTWADMRKEIRR